jgi:hypothetical protein
MHWRSFALSGCCLCPNAVQVYSSWTLNFAFDGGAIKRIKEPTDTHFLEECTVKIELQRNFLQSIFVSRVRVTVCIIR